MSDYGLRVYDSSGNVILEITDRITRLMYVSSQTASAGNSGALSQINNLLTGNFAVPVNASITKSAHIISRSSNTLTWTTWSGLYVTPATCVIFCFAYT